MNALVLVIAGVLVVVGIALIALSVVLARKQTTPGEPSATAAPATDADLLFIDQPLQADMAAALGHTLSPPGEAGPTQSVPVETTPSQQADEMTPSQQADDDPTEETSVVELQTQNDTGGSTRPDKED